MDKEQLTLVERRQNLMKGLEEAKRSSKNLSSAERITSKNFLPYDAYMLIDCSSSMGGSKISQAKKGTLKFVEDAISKGYSVGLISFTSEANLLLRPVKNIAGLKESLNTLTTSGSTNMTGALNLIIDEFYSTRRTKVAIVVTDGMPDNPALALETAEKIKALGIDIMVIGTDDAEEEFLKKLSNRDELFKKVERSKLKNEIASMSKLLPLKGA